MDTSPLLLAGIGTLVATLLVIMAGTFSFYIAFLIYRIAVQKVSSAALGGMHSHYGTWIFKRLPNGMQEKWSKFDREQSRKAMGL